MIAIEGVPIAVGIEGVLFVAEETIHLRVEISMIEASIGGMIDASIIDETIIDATIETAARRTRGTGIDRQKCSNNKKESVLR